MSASPPSPPPRRPNCRTAASARSNSPPPWRSTRKCCCSTSRPPAWATRTSIASPRSSRRVRANRTILMVEHNLCVVADLSDRITVLTRGRILAEGDYETVSANPEVREAYLGNADADGVPAPCSPSRACRLVRRIPRASRRGLRGRRGEVVTLLGRNGAGKTTTLKSIMGMVGKRTGSVKLRGPRADRPALRTGSRGRHRDLPGGARHLREPQCRGEPAAAAESSGRAGSPVARSSSCFPTSERRPARAPSCPAASSRCWRSAASCAPARAPPARRADRGAGAGDHPADRPHHPHAQGTGLHHRAGGAEFPFRRDRCAARYYVMEHGRVVEGFAQAELDDNRDKLQHYLGV